MKKFNDKKKKKHNKNKNKNFIYSNFIAKFTAIFISSNNVQSHRKKSQHGIENVFIVLFEHSSLQLNREMKQQKNAITMRKKVSATAATQ